jgi:hypothetical protein
MRIIERFVGRLGYAVSAAGPCGCAKGQSIAAARKERSAPPNPNVAPVVSDGSAAYATEALSALPFFPGSEAARTMIGNEIQKLCRAEGDVFWLVERMLRLYARWPGVLEMRLVYCSKHVPLDGLVPAQITTETYPDGIPAELPQPQTAPMLALPPGAVTSADPQLDDAVRELAEAKRLPAPHESFPIAVTPPKIPVTPVRHFTPITQADVDKAVAEYRQKKSAEIDERARKESGL